MDSQKQKELVLEHAQRVAQLSATLASQKKTNDNIEDLRERLKEIEHELDRDARQIAEMAVKYYLSDY